LHSPSDGQGQQFVELFHVLLFLFVTEREKSKNKWPKNILIFILNKIHKLFKVPESLKLINLFRKVYQNKGKMFS